MTHDAPNPDDDKDIDAATHSLLDSLDDELKPAQPPPDAATEALLQSLNDIKPQTVSEPLAAAVVDEATEDATRYRYRIAAALPKTLQEAITEALDTVDLDPAVGMFQWQASFEVERMDVLRAALNEWSQEHLPIETGTEKVYCAVEGSQTYVAGWTLANTSAIYQAQNALTTSLAAIVTPLAGESAVFRTILPVMVGVPADRFPQLVAHLHGQFTPETWSIQSLEILRIPIDDNGVIMTGAEWEVVNNPI